jgi:putative ABC transport system ATP-binding protein
MAPLIAARNLHKDYRFGPQTVPALRGVSVEIERGEFVAVMGPSGSGKSTFLNLLGFLDRPTAGEYEFEGKPVAGRGRDELAGLRNRAVGFVFQNFNLLPRHSAAENVELPLLYGGGTRAERRDKARRKLADVGLAHRERHHPSQLSGGEQQRVAIARAIANDPALVLADEPTGALDSKTSAEIMGLLGELNAAGITVVLVTHERDIAACCRRVLLFRDGRLVGDERPAAAAAESRP